MFAMSRIIIKTTTIFAIFGILGTQKVFGNVVEAKTKKELQSIIHSNAPVAIKFYRPSCPACKSFGPTFAQAAAEMPQVTFVAVDITSGEGNALGVEHNVQRIPTVVHFKHGQEIARKAGSHSKEEIKKVHSSR